MEENRIKYEAVVIGGSAGSLDVLISIVAGLPINLKATIIIVIHRKSGVDSILVDLLSTKTKLTVKEVDDKEQILPGCIYIAPPDYHLLVEDKNTFCLDVSEKVQFSRPSIDVTFESVAEVYGSKCIGVLLSGANADGTNGLRKIKSCGGVVMAEDPETAEVAYMPQFAIRKLHLKQIIKSKDLSGIICNLISIQSSN